MIFINKFTRSIVIGGAIAFSLLPQSALAQIILNDQVEQIRQDSLQRREADIRKARGIASYLQKNFPRWKESLPSCP